MDKKIIIILLLIFLILILLYKSAYEYFGNSEDSENKNKIFVGSVGMGSYGKMAVDYLLQLAYPDKQIIWVNDESKINLLVAFNQFNLEPIWQKNKHPCIYYSGENYLYHSNDFHTDFICLCSTTENIPNQIKDKTFHVPYTYATMPNNFNFNLTTRKNNNRPYFLAYCASNPVKEREFMFNYLVNNDKTNSCYSLGKCFGNNPKAIRKPIGPGWTEQKLIDEYSKYRFVLCMENSVVDGYITEKIINAFKSGAIPIYWGTDMAKKLFNPKAFINVSDFDSFESCCDYVLELDKNPQMIENMKNEPVFLNNKAPDVLRIGDFINPPEYYKNISNKLKQIMKM